MKLIVVKTNTMKTEFENDFLFAMRYKMASEGVSGDKLGNYVGCTGAHILKMKAGRSPGSEAIRRKISEFFGMSYESFIEFGRKVRRVEKPELEPPTPDPLPTAGLNELYRTIGAIEQRIQDLKTDMDNRYKALEKKLAEQEMRTQKKEMAPDTKQTGTDGAS